MLNINNIIVNRRHSAIIVDLTQILNNPVVKMLKC